MALLRITLKSNISAICIPMSPGQLVRLTPSTVCIQFYSSFWGRTLQTNLQYVTSLERSSGTLLLSLKKQVLVGIFMRPPIPWNSLQTSFANNSVQVSLNIGWHVSCLYLSTWPESVLRRTMAISKKCFGKWRLDMRANDVDLPVRL